MGKAQCGGTAQPLPEGAAVAPLAGGLLSDSEKLVLQAQARQDLVNMLVHDLKGPLAEIMANLDILGDAPLEPYYRECLHAAVFGAESLHRMVLDILDVAKFEEGKLRPIPEAVSLAELAGDSAKGLGRFALRKGVDVKITLCGGPSEVVADGFMVGRVITNLLLNAIEHTPEGSTVAIIINGDDRWVELSVVDGGPGISEELLPFIFNKYSNWAQRAGGRRYGTGLGLCFSRMAVEAHGGEIFVESKPGAGSKFGFRLPAKPKVNYQWDSIRPDGRG